MEEYKERKKEVKRVIKNRNNFSRTLGSRLQDRDQKIIANKSPTEINNKKKPNRGNFFPGTKWQNGTGILCLNFFPKKRKRLFKR